MATIAASLERSLQNCSLNRNTTTTNNNNGSDLESDLLINQRHRQRQRQRRGQVGMTPNNTSYASSSSSDDNSNSNSNSNSSTFVQLNSHLSLPYYWEQCLDLKTGELYYINWSTGKKMKEDPRTSATGYSGDYCLSEEEQEHEDDTDSEDSDCEEDEESSSCDSQGSSSCSSNRENFRLIKNTRHQPKLKEEELREEAVLVVAGCKSCFMYQMVPKHVDKCPKCQSPHLLHFPANTNSSSP